MKRIAMVLLLASPMLSSATASSKSYLDDPMTSREIQTYLQARMKGRSPHEARSLARLLIRLCRENGFTPETVLSVISAESGFDANAVSGRGAIGLMQLMPETARFIARHDHLYYRRASDLRNPKINIIVGIHYLGHLRDRFDTSREYLAAYNMGPAKFRRLVASANPAPVSVLRYVRQIQTGIFGVKRDARKMQARALQRAA